ncbi:hypothetical protein [Symbioplanes lichenis]|uniref:hypothetical protein n=1 Tax=Symbioplanes lichenis TaxID=1629072 RepID=UPI0027394268|nr:hypothetical protein [Actinoplanes lichenis]
MPFTGAVEPDRNVAIRREPAHEQLYATVARDDCFYPRIMSAYSAVEAAVAEAGLPLCLPIREIYLSPWVETGASEPFVDVAQPVSVA